MNVLQKEYSHTNLLYLFGALASELNQEGIPKEIGEKALRLFRIQNIEDCHSELQKSEVASIFGLTPKGWYNLSHPDKISELKMELEGFFSSQPVLAQIIDLLKQKGIQSAKSISKQFNESEEFILGYLKLGIRQGYLCSKSDKKQTMYDATDMTYEFSRPQTVAQQHEVRKRAAPIFLKSSPGEGVTLMSWMTSEGIAYVTDQVTQKNKNRPLRLAFEEHEKHSKSSFNSSGPFDNYGAVSIFGPSCGEYDPHLHFYNAATKPEDFDFVITPITAHFNDEQKIRFLEDDLPQIENWYVNLIEEANEKYPMGEKREYQLSLIWSSLK
ncbi:MAG: hypothetical protein CME32_11510 [Gimesia sp.]|nr:hypothetical protein [Gimesia sp.]